jgi:thiol-disulfide isomerase/thioredoxin
MFRYVAIVACSVAALFFAGCSSTGGGAAPSGLASPGSFLKTSADVVAVEFFDMYCHHCQSAAPHVVEAYRMAKSSMGSKVEFYGIAWGDTPMEAAQFQNRFNVPFPVIADKDLSISSRYGKFRPPLFIVLKKQGGKWVETFRTTDTHMKPAQIIEKLTS